LDVVGKIFEFANRTPDAWALVLDLEPTTYRALYRMITAMRHRLAAYGLRPGGVVVLWIQPALVSWVVNLDMRTLGMTTVSIRSPDEFASLTGLDIVAVVTAEDFSEIDPDLAPDATRIVVARADWDVADDGGPLEPPPRTPPGDHILLTSGTTGNHKMMIVDSSVQAAEIQIGVKNFLARLGEGATELRGSVNIFNLGLWTAVGYNYPVGVWSIGSTVIIHQGPDEWRSFLVPGITHAMITPGLLTQILATAPPTMPRNDRLMLMVTGGALSIDLANTVRARLTNTLVITLGSTESGAWAQTMVRGDEDLRWHRVNPNRTVEVVDEEDRPLPPNQLGQVRVLLDNSFTGYLNDPDATASFVKGRYFYPGDLGVLDGNGRISLHGRVTDVLNIMGGKHASGPYEAALQKALGLEGVCVFSEQGEGLQEQLHVVLETPGPIDDALLRQAAIHLEHLQAANFHFLDRFPRNHMGKVERFKLRQRLIEQQLARSQT